MKGILHHLYHDSMDQNRSPISDRSVYITLKLIVISGAEFFKGSIVK